MAFLAMIVHGREVRRLVLRSTTTSIGRAHDNDLVINNLALSRYHAEVRWQNGRYEIEDLGSQNGVFVNNRRVWNAHALTHADLITLGTYHFVFHAEDETSDGCPSKVERERTTDVPDADTAESRIPLLVVKYHDVELQRLPLQGEESLIGRSRECDIQIAERRLSRRHCRVYREDDRHYVADLGSHNGTYVNRQRIPGPCELRDGDVLNFAGYSVHFFEDDPPHDGPDRRSDTRPADPPPAPDLENADAFARPGRGGALPASHPRIVDPAGPRPMRSVRSPAEREAGQAAARRSPETKVLDPERVDPAAPLAERSRAPGAPAGARGDDPDRDVADLEREIRPERALDDWYRQREDSALHALESSGLSTMMVGKGDLDRHLRSRVRARRFAVRVEAQGRVLYEGPLRLPVTILGADDEADLQLAGRYVAGRHSLLVQVRDSLLLVRLGSSSAARVNGHPKLQAFLRSGDVIQIDETTIEIREV